MKKLLIALMCFGVSQGVLAQDEQNHNYASCLKESAINTAQVGHSLVWSYGFGCLGGFVPPLMIPAGSYAFYMNKSVFKTNNSIPGSIAFGLGSLSGMYALICCVNGVVGRLNHV